MHGLTTIAAIPRTCGAGMALRGETNTPRPKPYFMGPYQGSRVIFERTSYGWLSGCTLWMEIEREREAPDLAWLRGPTPELNRQAWDAAYREGI